MTFFTKIKNSFFYQFVIFFIVINLFDPGKSGNKVIYFSLSKTLMFIFTALLFSFILVKALISFDKTFDIKKLKFYEVVIGYFALCFTLLILLISLVRSLNHIFSFF
jgi:uncharacterized membrane protein